MAEELYLDWDAVKELDKQYMREQLRRAGKPGPRVIGIDEIAIAKGHKYRIVVSDLERGRPIWFGGQGPLRSEPGRVLRLARPEKCGKIRLAVMDMWKAFRNSTLKEGNAPQATILYDKFHVLMHLGKPWTRSANGNMPAFGEGPPLYQGAEYTLLSHWGNLTIEGKAGAQAVVQGQQAAAQGLPAQGVVRPTVGLPDARVGAALLRPVAGRSPSGNGWSPSRSSPR